MTFRSNAGVVVSGKTCSVIMAVLMLKRVLAALCELLLLVLVALLLSKQHCPCLRSTKNEFNSNRFSVALDVVVCTIHGDTERNIYSWQAN